MKYITSLSLICIIITASFNAQAELITRSWKTQGDELITVDTQSGLEWLSLSETIWMSYDDVTAQLGAGGRLEGWRYANV